MPVINPVPVGRALRVLRFLHEDDLSRAIEAQRAMRAGVDPKLALELLRLAKDTNRTFNYQLEHSKVALTQIPTVLIEHILDKKFPRSMHQQLLELGAPVSLPRPAAGNSAATRPPGDTTVANAKPAAKPAPMMHRLATPLPSI